MQNVDTVVCVNAGGFVMKFRVIWDGGDSGWSDEFPNPREGSFNMNNYNIPTGTQLGIEIDIVFGKNAKSSSSDAVAFSPNSNSTATYRVTGAALNPHISLEGPSDALSTSGAADQAAGA